MVDQKDIRQQIIHSADYYTSGQYAFGDSPQTSGVSGPSTTGLLSFYRDLELSADLLSNQFVPLSAVAQRGRNPKVFAVGILPPNQKVTGRLLDRTASARRMTQDLTGVNPDQVFAAGGSSSGVSANPGNLSPKRARVVALASSQLGQSDWTKYYSAIEPNPPKDRLSWCGIFCAWTMQESGLDASWKLGKGIQPPLPATQNPQPGDIIYLGDKTLRDDGKPLHHYAIVESVDGDSITTIDGNSKGRKVARNVRKREDIQTFFSIENVAEGEHVADTSPVTRSVTGDGDVAADWQSDGSSSAGQSRQDQDDRADTDLHEVHQGLLAKQAAQVKAIQDGLAAMAKTPPLRMLVNPSSFSVKSTKIVQDGNWGRDGPIIEFWGDDQDKISGSGKVAGFYAIDATGQGGGSGGPGLTRAARNFSQGYQNFQALWLLYRNNGGLYLSESLTQQNRDILLSTVGSVYLYYDNILYFGCFDSFNVTETDDKPFTLEYSFEFTVRAAFLLDFPSDLVGSREKIRQGVLHRDGSRGLPTSSEALSGRLGSNPSPVVQQTGTEALLTSDTEGRSLLGVVSGGRL
jgi:hypothetical protein